KLDKADVISREEFKTYMNNDNVQIVDVRGITEFEAGHVPGAHHVFVGTIEDNLDKIRRDKQVIVQCQAGDRSAVAYSVLARNGFTRIKNYMGGMSEWVSHNETVNCTTPTSVGV